MARAADASLAVTDQASFGTQALPNGISVGAPKVFDNRTLTLMLEALSENLRNITMVDQKALSEALKLVQGYQATDSAFAASVTAMPIPGMTTTTVGNLTSNVGNSITANGTSSVTANNTIGGNSTSTNGGTAYGTSNGATYGSNYGTGYGITGNNTLTDARSVTETLTREKFTPSAPTLGSAPAFSGYTPAYGQHASDLLNDQVNLSYQIFNLRMLLERSLSDRLLNGGETRLQAVLGFNVTLDPPLIAKDAVAVVEITLKTTSRALPDLSLVALMPQEKTYNSAALSNRSNAFGGAAVVNAFQIGVSQRSQEQTFYLYRDSDTVSYQRTDRNKPDEIVFGWMFRPVLGRRSVSPGMRQMFAIVALPAPDGPSPETMTAAVKTYWKKYDRDTMTSFTPGEANRRTKFLYALSLTLAEPRVFDFERYGNKVSYPFSIYPTKEYQAHLSPQISNVSWAPIGARTALVTAEGNNFFTGTQVAMADRVFGGAADGFVLKSSQAFDLAVPLDSLAIGAAAVVGRYGNAVPLEIATDHQKTTYENFRFEEGSMFYPPMSGVHRLTLRLKFNRRANVAPTDPAFLPMEADGRARQPIVTVNGVALIPPYVLTPTAADAWTLETNVADGLLKSGGAYVKVTWPFMPPSWTVSTFIPDLTTAYQVTRLSKDTVMIIATDRAGFTDDGWHLLVNDLDLDLKNPPSDPAVTLSRVSNHAIRVTTKGTAPERIVLVQPNNATHLLDVPKADKPATETKVITANQYSSVWVAIEVKDASKIIKVEANRATLDFMPVPPAKADEISKSIKVLLPKELTLKPADLDLTITAKEEAPVTITRVQILPVSDPDAVKKP